MLQKSGSSRERLGVPHAPFSRRLMRLSAVGAFLLFFIVTIGCAGEEANAGAPDISPQSIVDVLPNQGAAPDFELTNQDGERVRLADWRGRVVLLNFFYGDCGDFCPSMNRDLRSVHESLHESERERVALISVSFDPDVDTPERLRSYASEKGFDFDHWDFLTGTSEEVAGVADAFGIMVSPTEPEEHLHEDGSLHHHPRAFNHLAQALLIDPDGVVRKAFLGAPATNGIFSHDLLATDVKTLLQEFAQAG